jgi:hypothetical protein
MTYFVSSWAELPMRTEEHYAAIFNDALSWVHSDEEIADSLKGLHDCLRPGGILTYAGALPGMGVCVALSNGVGPEFDRFSNTRDSLHFTRRSSPQPTASRPKLSWLPETDDFQKICQLIARN